MTLDQDPAAVLQGALMTTAATLLVAKVCREFWADSLRRRLRALELELFELARRGRVGFREPAYLMLRDCIRDIVEFSHSISLGRILVIALVHRALAPKGLAADHALRWREAVTRVESEAAGEEITRIYEQALITVCTSMVPRWIPLPSLLTAPGCVSSAWGGVREFSSRSASLARAQLRHPRRMVLSS